MKSATLTLVLFVLAIAPAGALAQQAAPQQPDAKQTEVKRSAAPNSPEWQQLRSLVGQWQGTFEENGKKTESTLEVRMTGDGSAIMHLVDKDGPYEMVTMFHSDGSTLMATHYCAMHNQPRMQLAPAPGLNQIAFRFKDGTNIAPGDGHMVGLVITFIDADHHDEAWAYEEKGRELPAETFHYTRKR